MDIFLIIIAGLLLLIGLLGCVIPIIPGVPLSYVGILIMSFASRIHFSSEFLITWAIIVVAIQLLDFYIPVWGAKFFGGGRWGRIGSFVGIIVGLFFGPLGIILGPFFGAVLGELLSGRATRDALIAGFGAFVGFLVGTIAKLIVAGFLLYYYVEALITIGA